MSPVTMFAITYLIAMSVVLGWSYNTGDVIHAYYIIFAIVSSVLDLLWLSFKAITREYPGIRVGWIWTITLFILWTPAFLGTLGSVIVDALR